MRYEGQLLTAEESVSLIGEVDRWCRRTGTNYNKLVTLARVAPSIRSCVKTRGKRVTKAVAGRLRFAMKAYRYGISRQESREYLATTSAKARAMSDTQIEARRVYREPCPKCGTRMDLGCRHVSANQVEGK